MGAAKWLLFMILLATLSSVLVGAAEMSYLGPNLEDSSVMGSIFEVSPVSSQSEAGNYATLKWNNFPTVVWGILKGLWWNYSVLEHNSFGIYIRWILLRPISLAMFISFGLLLLSHVPWAGRGSQ